MRTKASLLGTSGGLHLGNVTMHMRVVEVMLWRDSMVRCCVVMNCLGVVFQGSSRCICRGET